MDAMDLKKTDFFRTAAKIHKLFEEDMSFDIKDVADIKPEETDDSTLESEVKELMQKLTDEERETVQAALEILKKYTAETKDEKPADEPVEEKPAVDEKPAE